MGHNRAEVRRLTVLAVREAGARACNPGPVPARAILGRRPLAKAWPAPVRLPGGSAVLASQLGEIGLFGAAEGRAPGALRTEPVIVPYVL